MLSLLLALHNTVRCLFKSQHQLALYSLALRQQLAIIAHLLTTVAKHLGPGGANAVIVENLLLKQQLLVISRSRRRAPNPTALDRFLFGSWSLFINPRRLSKVAVVIRFSMLLRFQEALKTRNYRLLFSSCGKRRPGPKGPSQELIQAIVEIKRRNPRYGCPRIDQQVSKAFGFDINRML